MVVVVVVVVEGRVLELELAAELLLPQTEQRAENVTNCEWLPVVEMATKTCSTRAYADAIVMIVVEESSHANAGRIPYLHPPLLILDLCLPRHG